MQERHSLHTKKSFTRFQISCFYFRTTSRECCPWFEVQRFSKRMGNSVQQRCGGSSAYGMRTLLYCNIMSSNDIILMLLDFLIWFSLPKDLEGKIQNCLKMMVGDNRLGTFLRVISWCTSFIYLLLLYRHTCFTRKYTTRKIHKNYIRDPSGLFSVISHVSLSMT